MKRLTLIIMASLLMLGLTQCKKEQTNTNANAEGEWVTITVKVDAGDRHIVYPGTGAVVYSNGDKIYVGNNGHYVGTLTYNDGAFSGQIQSPSTADYLHFYFIGGEYTGTLNAGTTESFDWSIADQSEKLPVLSYGHSTQKYTDGNATYGCTLENQCALVKFPLNCSGTGAGGTDLVVRVDGMHNTATVNFATANAGITATNATGTIKLYSESNTDKWAILLPQGAVASANTNAHVGFSTYTVTDIPTINANDYVTNGVGISYNAAASTVPVFSVGANTTVQFSPGNLQATYNGSSWSWAFAAHQWDYIGNAAANNAITGNGTVSANGTVDLFGWVGESSSYDNYGIFNSTTNSDYGTNLSDNLKHDWGVKANAANLGGHDDWRTLTKDEWVYLFNTRSTNTVNGTANARYAKAYLFGTIHGIILFPDNYVHPDGVAQPTGINVTGNTSWNGNTYNDRDWGKMADAGAVFLPAAGSRDGTSVNNVGGIIDSGFYWSATPRDENIAYGLYFSVNNVRPSYFVNRYFGFSVRLVR